MPAAVPFITMIMAVASAAAQAQASSQAASDQAAQNSAMRNAADANAKLEADSASNAAAQDYMAVDAQQQEINQQAAQDQTQRAMMAMRERAALRVASGESGVAGISTDMQEKDTFMSQGQDAATIETNRANKIKQSQLSKGSIEAQAQGRVNTSISNQRNTYANTLKKRGPSAWVSGLQIGAAGVSGYMQGETYRKQLGY